MHVVIHVGGEERSSWLLNPCLSVTDVGESAAHFHCCSFWYNILLQWEVRCLKMQSAWFFCTCFTSQVSTGLYYKCLNVASESGLVSDLRDGTRILKAPSRLCVEAGAWWLNWSWGTMSRCNAKATKWGMPERRSLCRHQGSQTNEIEPERFWLAQSRKIILLSEGDTWMF